MSTKANAFTNDLELFIQQAVDLRHVLHFLGWQFRIAGGQISKSLEHLGKTGQKDQLFSGTATSIVNIFHDGEWILRSPVGKRITSGDNVQKLSDEIAGRFNASILVCLHESLEVFLKGLYGKYLYQLRRNRTLANKQEFHRSRPAMKKDEGTLRYYREYAAWSCRRDCSKALDVFETTLDWDQAIINGWAGMSWVSLARTLAYCRHCVVHVDGDLSDVDSSGIDKRTKDFVMSIATISVLTGGARISPGEKDTERLIEAILSFAYGLYVLLSNRFNMTVEINHLKKRKK